jgi:hypothetical protein
MPCPARGRRHAVWNPQNAMYRMTARTGWIRVRTPIEMSPAPTTGMSFHAHASGIPTIAKYGSQAALVMTPKAPWRPHFRTGWR